MAGYKTCEELSWSPHAGQLMLGLASLDLVPELRGRYRHPMVGKSVEGVFLANPPRLPGFDSTKYVHVKELFSYLPLDELSRARAYMYLFGCFHTLSLVEAVPLLVIDSWTQARGKTELAAAISILLDGDSSPLTYTGELDSLVAHLVRGRRMAIYDNVEIAPRRTRASGSLFSLDRHRP